MNTQEKEYLGTTTKKEENYLKIDDNTSWYSESRILNGKLTLTEYTRM